MRIHLKKFCLYLLIFVFLILILFTPTVGVSGVKLGINLLLFSLIPALLPFIILSNVIIKLNTSEFIGRLFHPLFKRLFHVSSNGSYAILMGYLCGYPIGAKVINDLLENNKISQKESAYLFCFINNPSPVFIQGYLLINLLHSPQFRVLALILTYMPTLILGFFTREKEIFQLPDSSIEHRNLPSKSELKAAELNDISKISISKLIDDSILNGFITISKLGGYLIIFSIFSIGITKLYFIPSILRTVLICIMEITTGTYYISLLDINTLIKVFCCVAASIFGGLSTVFQTKSVSKTYNQNIRKYLLFRIIAVFLCFILFTLYLAVTSFL